MRVAFLLPSLRPSGGVHTVISHARRLAGLEGFEPEIVLASDRVPEPPSISGLLVRDLEGARAQRYDVAIATWWETTRVLFDLDADRRVCFLQSFEQRFYRQDELVEQLGAEAVLALPLDFIVVAQWMKDLLLAIRPGASCFHVSNGVDKDVFGVPRTNESGPLRVLVEGHPSLWFKGVHDALAAVAAMKEPHEVTLLALDPEAAQGLPVDRVVGGLEPPGVAEVYAQADVLVKFSRVEALTAPPLEAAHAGVPSVVTPFTGHDEYIRHGENGLVVGFDDSAGAARSLDLLARDRGLLKCLSDGALESAERWPSAVQAADAFAHAMKALVAAPLPEADSALLQRTLTLHTELGRDQAGRLRYTEEALAGARAHVHDLALESEARRVELAELRSTRAYRAHRALARLRWAVKR